jgi:hypothetical protein
MLEVVNLIIATLTVAMEAGGEPRKGKLAVAWVLQNRVHAGISMTDVILKPWQFSAWNTDSPTRLNIDQLDADLLAECMSCVLAATHRLEPDPTNGAYFYLNKQVVIHANGALPDWWNIDGIAASEITLALAVLLAATQGCGSFFIAPLIPALLRACCPFTIPWFIAFIIIDSF